MATTIKQYSNLPPDTVERLSELTYTAEQIQELDEALGALELIVPLLKSTDLFEGRLYCEKNQLRDHSRFKDRPVEDLDKALQFLVDQKLIELSEYIFHKSGRPRKLIMAAWSPEEKPFELWNNLMSRISNGRNSPFFKTRVQEVAAQRWVCKRDLSLSQGRSGGVFYGKRGQPFPSGLLMNILNTYEEISQIEDFIGEYLSTSVGGTSIVCPHCNVSSVHYLGLTQQ